MRIATNPANLPLPVSDVGLSTTRRVDGFFRRFSTWAANAVGSNTAFFVALLTVAVWAATGPIFRFSDTWQLVINTGTTIVTFLMVFLIQNTQNRDAKAIHLKLDELIRGVKGARTHLVNLEEFTDEELAHLQKQFEGVRAHAAEKLLRRADEVEQKVDHAGRTAEEAHRKADRAEDVSEKAEDTADDAHDAARAAREAAEEARERARRAEERAARAGR